jgi:hypothetical protein
MSAKEYCDDDECYGEAASYGEERSHGAHGDLSKQKGAGPQRECDRNQDLSHSFVHLYLKFPLFHADIILSVNCLFKPANALKYCKVAPCKTGWML